MPQAPRLASGCVLDTASPHLTSVLCVSTKPSRPHDTSPPTALSAPNLHQRFYFDRGPRVITSTLRDLPSRSHQQGNDIDDEARRQRFQRIHLHRHLHLRHRHSLHHWRRLRQWPPQHDGCVHCEPSTVHTATESQANYTSARRVDRRSQRRRKSRRGGIWRRNSICRK